MNSEEPLYLETLPKHVECPPVDAVQLNGVEVVRAVSTEIPTILDFLSYAALGVPIRPDQGDVDPCRYASCSVYTSSKINKLPRFRSKPFLAYFDIVSGAGKCKIRKAHIDLWMFREFDPCAAVKKVVRKGSPSV